MQIRYIAATCIHARKVMAGRVVEIMQEVVWPSHCLCFNWTEERKGKIIGERGGG